MSHSYRSLFFHLIYHVKRQPVSPDDVAPLHAYLHGVLSSIGCRFISLGGTSDHVHIVAEFPIGDMGRIIGQVKTAGTRWLKQRAPEKYRQFAWQGGSGLFTVSYSMVGKVRQYVLSQEEHHRKISTRDEYAKLLRLHQIEVGTDASD